MTKKALKWNVAQGFTPDEIYEISSATGCVSEGGSVWTVDLVDAVKSYQRVHGVTPDGMIQRGPKSPTWRQVRKDTTDLRKPVVRGIWMDDMDALHSPDRLMELVDHGITSVSFMADRANQGWNPALSDESLAKKVALCEEKGIRVAVTIWPDPNPEYLKNMADHMALWLHTNPGIKGLEVDVEGNWHSRRVKGYKSLAAASEALVEALHKLRDEYGVKLEATTYTHHQENTTNAGVAKYSDMVFPQAYSVNDRGGKHVPWGHAYGPERMIKTTLTKTNRLIEASPSSLELGVGLAAYEQQWPGRTPFEAMYLAYRNALAYSPKEIRWWSYKWVFGRRATNYGRDFFEFISLGGPCE